MDWIKRMNSAISYIEENLKDEISIDKAAQIVCCSTYHFQRMFSFITGVSLSEYIRRRRLTLAAFELQTSDSKVIDIAMKYGYDSPDAFTRAFKNMHGVAPANVRNINVSLKSYSKMTFSISIKGDSEMNYRIEKRAAFEVFGIYTKLSSNMEQAFADVPNFARQGVEDGTWDRFNSLLGRPHDSWFLATLFDHTETSFKYMMCYYLPQGLTIPAEYTKLKVGEQLWAIFSVPNGDMPNVWRRIYSEWFPTSEYEQVKAPCFEMYYGYGQGNTSFGVSEIWIPVKKK